MPDTVFHRKKDEYRRRLSVLDEQFGRPGRGGGG